MPDRIVRFTDQFFDRLDTLLPVERGTDGVPSVTDFLLLDLPAIRDELASNFEDCTLPTDDPDVRVYVGAGVLFRAVAIFVALDGNSVEAFWVMFDDAGTD
ncbi:MAG: hypothetical protein EA389_00025 [Ilumatobacter sp.]|nr:MAG: hypothetical protein EA389_00025 [Ilumatobacter sp.]